MGSPRDTGHQDATRRIRAVRRRAFSRPTLVLVAVVMGVAAHMASAAGARHCGDIPFRSATQHSVAPGVTDIRATGIDCRHARLLAAASKGCRGCTYHEGRFHCVPGRRRPTLPTSYPYRCTRADARVTFTRWA